MKGAHSTVIVCWMMRRGRMEGSVNGTLIPYAYSLASIVVAVDRTGVEKTLRLVTVT